VFALSGRCSRFKMVDLRGSSATRAQNTPAVFFTSGHVFLGHRDALQFQGSFYLRSKLRATRKRLRWFRLLCKHIKP
jgi:hypothetical protein